MENVLVVVEVVVEVVVVVVELLRCNQIIMRVI